MSEKYTPQDLQDNLDYLNETKDLIKQALIDKEQQVLDTDTFRSYADKIRAIETGINSDDATATSSDIIAPKTAYVNGEKITGSIKAQYKSDYSKIKTLNYSNVLDFNNVIAICGDIKSRNIKVYKVEETKLIHELIINFDDLNIPDKYVLYAAGVSKISLNNKDNIYNIGIYVCDPSSARCSDQAFYLVRFDIKDYKIIENTADLPNILFTNIDFGTSENCTGYGLITTHPTNPNCFICSISSNNASNGRYGRLHSMLIKYDTNTPVKVQISLHCSASAWTNTFSYIDILPINSTYTYILQKGVKNGSSQYVRLDKFNEITNKCENTPFNEVTYGAAILSKKYYIYNNNKLVSMETGSVIGDFPITLSYKNILKSVGDNQFLLFDIESHTVKLYNYDELFNKVELKETNTYSDLWNINSRIPYMTISNIDSNINYYDYSSSIVSVWGNNSEIITSFNRHNKSYFDTSDANAITDNILEGKTAYISSGKIAGTLKNIGNLNLVPGVNQLEIPKGYTDGGCVLPANITRLPEYNTCLDLSYNILGTTPSIQDYTIMYLDAKYGVDELYWFNKVGIAEEAALVSQPVDITNASTEGIVFSGAGSGGKYNSISVNQFYGTYEMYVKIPSNAKLWQNGWWCNLPCLMGVLINKSDDAGYAQWGVVINVDGYLCLGVQKGYTHTSSGVKICDDKFHHIVVTLDTTNAKLYVDGILKVTLSNSTAIKSSIPSKFGIMWSNQTPNPSTTCDGTVRAVRAYSIALTQEEILDKYSEITEYWNGGAV